MTSSIDIKADSKARFISSHNLALIILVITPALLCSNLIVARAVADIIPPFTLAFTRWLAAVLILLPFISTKLWRYRSILLAEWRQLLLLGSLGMGICGAFPYLGAKTTTATNIGLIYALSPIFIILFARTWYAEHLTKRQLIGVLLSLGGVVIIVTKGDLARLISLSFTVGDWWILAASASWAFYSLWQGYLKSQLSLFLRFGAMSIGGVIALLPFSFIEVYQLLPLTIKREFVDVFVITIIFLALVSSILAYAAYAYIQKILGASKASLVMYALPLYNAAMAWLFLDEKLQNFHFIGALLILPGLFLAVSRKAKSQ
ncbi:MAG: hypothetical protein OFPII_20140 [Osedax symbiont Rs1]|nr:MAG: hypothetical protein OFPII_20140 [Osedax symbiont Rs1]